MQPQTPHTPENWSAASRGYADNAPRLIGKFTDALIERLEVDPSIEAVEVAAGTGALTLNLAPKVKSVHATDFASEMITVLRERLSATGQTNVTCEVMDGQALTLEDASFDRAVCSFALMFFPDRAKGFAELQRVLRPGGRAAVSGWAGPDEFDGLALFLQGLKTALPDMPPPPGPPPVFSLADPASFAAQMEAAGFEDVGVDKAPSEMQVDGFEDFWALFTVGAPQVKVLFDRAGPEGIQKLHDTLAKIIDERFGSGPFSITNTATIGYGVARAQQQR